MTTSLLSFVGFVTIAILVIAGLSKCAEALGLVADSPRATDKALKRIEAALKEKEAKP